MHITGEITRNEKTREERLAARAPLMEAGKAREEVKVKRRSVEQECRLGPVMRRRLREPPGELPVWWSMVSYGRASEEGEESGSRSAPVVLSSMSQHESAGMHVPVHVQSDGEEESEGEGSGEREGEREQMGEWEDEDVEGESERRDGSWGTRAETSRTRARGRARRRETRRTRT